MILIVCALKCEANPIIDLYKLKRVEDIAPFELYTDIGTPNGDNPDKVVLVISGVGGLSSASALSYATGISHKLYKGNGKNRSFSHYFNIGICGATSQFDIGSMVVPTKIIDLTTRKTFYPEPKVRGGFFEGTIGTAVSAIKEKIADIDFYDMEGASFFEAASRFQDIQRIDLIKIVSDNLSEEDITKINKSFVSDLIQSNIEKIRCYIHTVLELTSTLKNSVTPDEEDYLYSLVESYKLTVTQRHQLFTLARGYKVRGGEIRGIIKDTLDNVVEPIETTKKDAITINSKESRNEWFKAIAEKLRADHPTL